MGDSLRVDEDPLRALASKFRAIAADADAALAQLRSVLMENGQPWGNDDIGKSFAKTYVPDEQQTLSNSERVAKGLGTEGANLLGLLESLQQHDQIASRMLAAARPTNPLPVAPVSSSAVVPAGAQSNIAPAQPDSPATQAAPPTARTDSGAANDGGSASRVTPGGPGVGNPAVDPMPQSVPASTLSNSAQPAAPVQPADQPSNPARSENPIQPSGPVGSPNRALPDATAAAAPGTAATNTSQTGRPTPAAVTGDGRENTRANRAGGQSGSSSGTTPWSGQRPSGRGVSAPHGAGRGAPPRPAARPNSPKSTKKVIAQPDPISEETLAMRLARQLAEKYGLETYGFDTPGIDDAVVTQFAAAIDDTLTRHPPLVLITLSIAELPEGELIRSSTDESADGVSGSHLVLSPIAARSLGPADERIAAERSAGQWPVTVDLPPVYALVIRELGYAMDAVGGYRARVAVREMEIPDQSGVPGDPAAVVAAAFAEVELTAAAAGPRSRALYRVLLDAADSARRSIEPR